MASIKFRLAKKSDIAAMVSLLAVTFSKADAASAQVELNEMFSSAVNKPVYVVAEKSKQIVGVLGYIQSWMDFNVYELFWAGVHPEHQGQGIGALLVK